VLAEEKMNDENQANERPIILTAPASVAVPGFGFLVALNPDWCFGEHDSSRTRHRQVCRSVSKVFDDFWLG
jgi:hypothetical protein